VVPALVELTNQRWDQIASPPCAPPPASSPSPAWIPLEVVDVAVGLVEVAVVVVVVAVDLVEDDVVKRLARLFARLGTSTRAEATSLAFRGLAAVGSG